MQDWLRPEWRSAMRLMIRWEREREKRENRDNKKIRGWRPNGKELERRTRGMRGMGKVRGWEWKTTSGTQRLLDGDNRTQGNERRSSAKCSYLPKTSAKPVKERSRRLIVSTKAGSCWLLSGKLQTALLFREKGRGGMAVGMDRDIRSLTSTRRNA